MTHEQFPTEVGRRVAAFWRSLQSNGMPENVATQVAIASVMMAPSMEAVEDVIRRFTRPEYMKESERSRWFASRVRELKDSISADNALSAAFCPIPDAGCGACVLCRWDEVCEELVAGLEEHSALSAE